jgi:hypothetical protein
VVAEVRSLVGKVGNLSLGESGAKGYCRVAGAPLLAPSPTHPARPVQSSNPIKETVGAMLLCLPGPFMAM